MFERIKYKLIERLNLLSELEKKQYLANDMAKKLSSEDLNKLHQLSNELNITFKNIQDKKDLLKFAIQQRSRQCVDTPNLNDCRGCDGSVCNPCVVWYGNKPCNCGYYIDKQCDGVLGRCIVKEKKQQAQDEFQSAKTKYDDAVKQYCDFVNKCWFKYNSHSK